MIRESIHRLCSLFPGFFNRELRPFERYLIYSSDDSCKHDNNYDRYYLLRRELGRKLKADDAHVISAGICPLWVWMIVGSYIQGPFTIIGNNFFTGDRYTFNFNHKPKHLNSESRFRSRPNTECEIELEKGVKKLDKDMYNIKISSRLNMDFIPIDPQAGQYYLDTYYVAGNYTDSNINLRFPNVDQSCVIAFIIGAQMLDENSSIIFKQPYMVGPETSIPKQPA